MAQAIRTLTVEQGIEPRDFALVAFGGAGPMHAAFLAQELGIGEVIVPRLAGAFSAWGMLETELRRDFTRPFFRRATDADLAELAEACAQTARRGARGARGRGSAGRRLPGRAHPRHALRGAGVHPRDPDRRSRRPGGARLRRGDDATLQRGSRLSLRPLEPGRTGRVRLAPRRRASATSDTPSRRSSPRAGRGRRRSGRATCSSTESSTPTAILRRDELGVGAELEGPLVVEEVTATTVVPPGCTLSVDRYGSLVILIGKEA